MTVTQWLMQVVIFLAFCAGVVSSDAENKTIPDCMYRPGAITQIKLFTVKGVPLPTKSIALRLKQQSEIGCILRMNKFALQPKEKHILIYFFLCSTPHPIFFDTENVTIMQENVAYLQLKNCHIDGFEILKFEQLYDLKVFTYFDTVPTSRIWLGENSVMANVSRISRVVAYTIKSDKHSNNLPWLLEANETFPSMAELSLTGIGLNRLPSDMSVRFPKLQSIELNDNLFSSVPSFPYTETPAFLPFNLSRTPNMQHHYALALGINIRPDMFRRILVLDKNIIEKLDDYFVNGTLQMISINSNRLTNISDRAFNRVTGLQVLLLQNNFLVTVNDKVFSKCKGLTQLDLSRNDISSIEPNSFKNLSNLIKLDLSSNNLTLIPAKMFYSLTSLHTLKLNRNYLSKFDETILPISLIKLRIVELRMNRFQTLPIVFFLIRDLEKVDLSQCQITIDKMKDLLKLINDSDFIDSIIVSASQAQANIYAKREKKRIIDLSSNLIRRLDFSGFTEVDEKKMVLILNNFELILTDNPIECDCHLVPLLDFFAKVSPTYLFDGKEYFYQKWLCHSPFEFRGRKLLSLQKADLYCREDMAACPSGCTCYRRHVSRLVIVNCTHKGLVSFPDKMPADKLEVWLQHNNISELASKSYLPRIEILKMTNNRLTTLSVSILKQMTALKTLYLDSNLLITLPKGIQELDLDLLYINTNHLICDCRNQWMKNWLLTAQTRVQDWQKITCSTNEDKVINIIKVPDKDFICIEEDNFKKTLALGLSLGFAILLVLICLYFLFYYRLEVKVLIYIYFNLHPFDCDPQKIDDEKEPIDTLVICSKSMIEWVSENVTEALESLRFNVLDINRDFLIGMSIRENMRIAVSRSKRSIVILSMDSFNDPMVQLALTFTHEKVLRERSTYMVLFLHEVKKRAIENEELKKYLTNGRYVRTGDSMLKQKMLYMLTGSNKTKNQGTELRRKKSYKIYFPEIMDTSSSPPVKATYDIFVSYPDHDYQFATGVLFTALHTRGYRVCLPDRDFMVGSSKEENILNAIERSRRTLVIITQNHVDDEWQLFTLRTAIERSLKETTNYLLCMLDPNVDPNTLDPETKAFLSTHVVIFQDDPMFWQKFYRSIPPPAFKEPDHVNNTNVHISLSEPILNSTNTSKTVFSITEK